MKRWKLGILAIGIGGLAWSAYGQPADFEQRKAELEARVERFKAAKEAATTTVNGKEHPEQVPSYFRMDVFFLMYTTPLANDLKAKLSSADNAVVEEFAARQADAQKEDAAAGKQRYMDLGARAQNMTAVQIAEAQNQRTASYIARKNEIYDGIINQLSKDGQELVTKWAFDRVRPDYTRTDQLALANADPEIYKGHFLAPYNWELKGGGAPPGIPQPPADVKPKQKGAIATFENEEEPNAKGEPGGL